MEVQSEIVEAGAPNLEAALRTLLDRIVQEVRWAAAHAGSASSTSSRLGFEELIVRLRGLYPARSSTRAEPLQVGELSIDLASHEVRVSAREVHLTRREFGVLRLLLEERDRALSREEILARVWGAGEVYSRRTVDIHVHRLRTKLGSSFTERLQTLRNVGYKLRYEPLPPDVH